MTKIANVLQSAKFLQKLIVPFAVIGIIVFSVFGQVAGHDFIRIDDPDYIVQNPNTRAGISIENIKWAFTSFHASNWHTVTWLSHMADSHLFGMKPGAHHMAYVQTDAGLPAFGASSGGYMAARQNTHLAACRKFIPGKETVISVC